MLQIYIQIGQCYSVFAINKNVFTYVCVHVHDDISKYYWFFFTFLCILCNGECLCVKASFNKIILIKILSSAQCYWKLLNMLIWGPVTFIGTVSLNSRAEIRKINENRIQK